jgi:hypothetical protein
VIDTTLPWLRHVSSAAVAISRAALVEIERSLTSVCAPVVQGSAVIAAVKTIFL